ncbi:MAG: hypothetical protein QM765_53420 [Myxococcales bacterium]
MTVRHPLILIATVATTLLSACEELPAEPVPVDVPNADEAPSVVLPQVLQAPPQLEGLGLWGLGVPTQAPGEEAPAVAEVEEAPERVDWTLSETVLRHYLDWQRHLHDANALAQLEQRVADDERYSEAVRERARDFVDVEPPERSFARFGLSRVEVAHAETLCQELASLREPDELQPLPDLRGRAGTAERRFLDSVREHAEESLREAATGMRARYGDANVDLLLRYEASLPADLEMLGETEEPEPENDPAPVAENEAEAEAPAQP